MSRPERLDSQEKLPQEISLKEAVDVAFFTIERQLQAHLVGEEGSTSRKTRGSDLTEPAKEQARRILRELPQIIELLQQVLENPGGLSISTPNVSRREYQLQTVTAQPPFRAKPLAVITDWTEATFDSRRKAADPRDRIPLPENPEEAILQIHAILEEFNPDSDRDVRGETDRIGLAIEDERLGKSAFRAFAQEKFLSSVRQNLLDQPRMVLRTGARRTYYQPKNTATETKGFKYVPLIGVRFTVNFAGELTVESENLSLAEWPHLAEVEMGGYGTDSIVSDLDRSAGSIHGAIHEEILK